MYSLDCETEKKRIKKVDGDCVEIIAFLIMPIGRLLIETKIVEMKIAQFGWFVKKKLL